MAILQTRDQVVRALDKHLQELHSLRRALGHGDTSLMATLPTPESQTKPAVAAPVLPRAHSPSSSGAWPAPAVAALRAAPNIVAAASAAPAVPEPISAVPIASNLEKATLEELNAALAFAFAHVSNAQKIPSRGLPTQPANASEGFMGSR